MSAKTHFFRSSPSQSLKCTDITEENVEAFDAYFWMLNYCIKIISWFNPYTGVSENCKVSTFTRSAKKNNSMGILLGPMAFAKSRANLVQMQQQGLFHGSAYRKKKKSALTEAENSVLIASIFHGLAVNFSLCTCAIHVTRHSTLTRLAHIFAACT